jgi:uracil-DNA glycosylase family 4
MTEKDKALRRMATKVRRCRKCALWKTRTSAVPGEGAGNARIFLVGEAPGKAEDETGKPFAGSAGRILGDALKKAGLDRSDVFITSILRCRPPKNRNPKAAEISACRPHLEEYIDTISPIVLVALGRFGMKGLTGKAGTMSKMRKEKSDYNGIPIVVTYHPAAVLYNRGLLKTLISDLRKAKRLASK